MSDQADRAVEYMKQEREDAQDLRQICNRIDFDGNGRIAWPEFEAYTWLHSRPGGLSREGEHCPKIPSEHLSYR